MTINNHRRNDVWDAVLHIFALFFVSLVMAVIFMAVTGL